MSDTNGNDAAVETVTLTIDGEEVTVPRGTTVLEAAASVGTEVPHYCYHEGLSSPAMCRLCLVEVEGAPKLQPSCVTQAQDDQVVRTQADDALRMRRGVLEFYLVNHPLDCPICDQSGECYLQDYVHEEGRAHGRSREPKRIFGRDDFGGDVLFYGDRCVMCTRCVRFMNEVEQDPRLTVVERGSRSIIDTFFEEGLDGTKWSGNIVDICPVGALVSKDFLYKQRAWDLDHRSSICSSCSQGCNISLHTRDNLVQRLKPRKNLDVNGHWMCDYGRHRFEFMNRQDRLTAPLMGRGTGRTAPGGAHDAAPGTASELAPGMAAPDAASASRTPPPTALGWREALTALVEKARSLGGPDAGPRVKAVVSPDAPNEDIGALADLIDTLGGGEIVYRMRRAEEEEVLKGFPTLARRRDLAANGRGAELIGATRVGDDDATGGLEDVAGHEGIVLVLGDELDDQSEDFGRAAALYVYLGAHPSRAATHADAALPVTTFAEQEGTFTNLHGRVQRFEQGLHPPGAARPAWLILGALAAELAGRDTAPTSADEAFTALAGRVEAFAGLTYASIGERGAVVNETVRLAGEG